MRAGGEILAPSGGVYGRAGRVSGVYGWGEYAYSGRFKLLNPIVGEEEGPGT